MHLFISNIVISIIIALIPFEIKFDLSKVRFWFVRSIERLLKRMLNTDHVFMKISDIYFSFLILMKFTLFNLNNNPKSWILHLHYSKDGVFQKGQSYISPFLKSTMGGAITSFFENRNQDQTLRAGISCTDWKQGIQSSKQVQDMHYIKLSNIKGEKKMKGKNCT